MGFDLVLDQGMARIYRIAGNAYFGIVDGNKGHLRHRPESAALLTIVSEDVAGWHAKLSKAGVEGLSEILRGTYCEHFFFQDPPATPSRSSGFTTLTCLRFSNE